MKKLISTMLVCVLLMGCMLALTSCGNTLMGEYEADMILYEANYEFKLGGKVVLTIDPVAGEDLVFEGEYSLNKDATEITFVFENEDAKDYTGTRSFAQGKENGVKYIKMNGVKYTKED